MESRIVHGMRGGVRTKVGILEPKATRVHDSDRVSHFNDRDPVRVRRTPDDAATKTAREKSPAVMRMPRPLVALALLADSAGALLMTRRTPASRRRPQLRARADADEAEELRRIFESGADLLTPEEEMANEDAREGVASVFDAEDMRTLFHEGLAAEGDAPPTLAKSAGSLADMDDASFKLLMWKRLGQNDFDRIFKGPRVEFEI